MIDTEARTTPSAYPPILTPHKLLKSFDEEIAGLRDIIGAKLLRERSSATDASDLEVVWVSSRAGGRINRTCPQAKANP